MGLTISQTVANFQSPNGLAAQQAIVTGGLAPYSASSSDTSIATVAQGASPNLYGNSDTLSDSTLSGLTLASGGPNGATDAEYTGTGSAVGSNPYVYRNIAVTMGQTYVLSCWIDPSQITNNTGSQARIFLGDINGTGILIYNLPSTATTAGRYATSAWTCPTNLCPHSDFDNGGADWSQANSGATVSVTAGGPGGANAYVVPASTVNLGWNAKSPAISVSAGDVITVSGFINASACSGAAPYWALMDGGNSTLYATAYATNGTSGRFSASYTVGPGVTSVSVYCNSHNTTTTGSVTFSQPMVERKSSASGYYISSQNPQVQVFAQLLSSAIVTNGQKFKISQPMLSLSTYDPTVYISQTSLFNITPKYRGSATITYSDSTP